MKKEFGLVIMTVGLFVLGGCEKKDFTVTEPDNMGRDLGCDDPPFADYVLPFPVGAAYELLQGNCGSFDHELNTRYAFDFEMPIGSVVTAAQEGTVLALEEEFSDGNNQRNAVNAVLIEHENGTVGRYLHLMKDGVLVEIGDFIERGDTIALSGNTGFIPQPQLQFDVIRCGINCSDFTSISIDFTNADPPVREEGLTYTAMSY